MRPHYTVAWPQGSKDLVAVGKIVNGVPFFFSAKPYHKDMDAEPVILQCARHLYDDMHEECPSCKDYGHCKAPVKYVNEAMEQEKMAYNVAVEIGDEATAKVNELTEKVKELESWLIALATDRSEDSCDSCRLYDNCPTRIICSASCPECPICVKCREIHSTGG